MSELGRTGYAIKTAPQGAVYVWPSERLSYPKDLAKVLGRDDLRIRPLSWLCPRNVWGCRCFVVLDHAVVEYSRLDSLQREALHHLRFNKRLKI